MKVKLKNKLRNTIILSGALLAFAVVTPSFAQYGPGATTAPATTADRVKRDGAPTTTNTPGEAHAGGIGTTSCGSTSIIRNGL